MSAYSFGDLLRASRLGYHWVERWACFIRASIVDDNCIRLEAATPRCIPGHRTPTKGARHVCWWEGPELMGMVQSPTLDHGVRGFASVLLDNSGREVQRES